MRRTLGIVVMLAATGCAAHANAPASDDAGAPAVPTTVARMGTFTSHVRATGRIGSPAGSESKLAFAGSGIVKTVDVRVGDHVRAGDALAELDTSGLAIDARQAEHDALAAANAYRDGTVGAAGVASARAKLAAAQSRLAMLRAGNGTSDSDAAAAATAVRQSQEKVALDQRGRRRGGEGRRSGAHDTAPRRSRSHVECEQGAFVACGHRRRDRASRSRRSPSAERSRPRTRLGPRRASASGIRGG
jgi:multidrug efflux pump subunit AcrA (membrane-fusion protein)